MGSSLLLLLLLIPVVVFVAIVLVVALVLGHLRNMALMKSQKEGLSQTHAHLIRRLDALEQDHKELRERLNQIMLTVDDLSHLHHRSPGSLPAHSEESKDSGTF
jgi:uncharacterized protein YoxC